MLTLTIDNPKIEEYIKKECHNNISNFIDKMAEFVETQKIKSDIKEVFKELELAKNGKLELTPIEDLLDND